MAHRGKFTLIQCSWFLTPFSLLAQGGTEGFDLLPAKRWDLSESVKTTVLLKAIPLDETVDCILNVYAFFHNDRGREQGRTHFYIGHNILNEKLYSLHHYIIRKS